MGNELIITISIISVVISLISAIFTLLQARSARKSNMIPIITEMLSEYRSSEFKEHCRFCAKLDYSRYSHPCGFQDLDNLDKLTYAHVRIVSHFFDHIGLLVNTKFVDKDIILKFMSKDVSATWEKLRGFILDERDKTGNEYQIYFEYLAGMGKNYKYKSPKIK